MLPYIPSNAYKLCLSKLFSSEFLYALRTALWALFVILGMQ
ncbi:hypothetical protein ANAPC5_00250 [Anaplasma phagocytophilum]|nr:hypothetical protein ANAPC3_00063 [Anaplasma phagocytophilum]SBO31216.1 hypothetical protein ANAPC2_00555 [Anaplasma phagocytophilum]SCV62445.1 hypothetical protein ANAPC5_00250 [Anaplasma phagocytophilum]